MFLLNNVFQWVRKDILRILVLAGVISAFVVVIELLEEEIEVHASDEAHFQELQRLKNQHNEQISEHNEQIKEQNEKIRISKMTPTERKAVEEQANEEEEAKEKEEQEDEWCAMHPRVNC